MIPSDVGGGDGIFSAVINIIKARQGTWVAEGLNDTGGTTTTPGNGYKYHFLVQEHFCCYI